MAKANLAARDRHPDDAGAFPILEAVFVAVLIITTIIFFTSLQRPTTGTDVGGIDLGRLASDTLAILQTKEFTRASCPELADGLGLEEWLGEALNGTACVTTEVESFLSEVLPPGTQFLLRLDNGVSATSSADDLYADALVLVPAGEAETPRAARAASTYVVLPWLAYRGQTTAQIVYPGQELTAADTSAATFLAAGTQCIRSPTGNEDGPGGASWLSIWQDPDTAGRVPSIVPYGTWAAYSNPTCSSAPTYLHVGLRDGTRTDYPVHALQLVVWFGA